jgi:hypothetical protein
MGVEARMEQCLGFCVLGGCVCVVITVVILMLLGTLYLMGYIFELVCYKCCHGNIFRVFASLRTYFERLFCYECCYGNAIKVYLAV